MDEMFGAQLKAIRQERGLSREELSERMGTTTPARIWECEVGRRDVRLSTLRRFAAALDVSPAVLLEERS